MTVSVMNPEMVNGRGVPPPQPCPLAHPHGSQKHDIARHEFLRDDALLAALGGHFIGRLRTRVLADASISRLPTRPAESPRRGEASDNPREPSPRFSESGSRFHCDGSTLEGQMTELPRG